MVSAGYILENDKGFRWTANDRYLLFKDTALAIHPSSPPLTNTSLSHQLFSQSPTRLQTRLRTTPQISQAPTFSPTFRFPQWSFPPNSLWKESFPSAILQYANNFQIECSVNAGYLLADATSIRNAHSNACILEYAGQRPDGERLHAGRVFLAEKTEVPTPIVERRGREAFYGYREGNKGVLFDKTCANLDASGVVEYGQVADNEGKTDLIYGVWPKTLQRRVIMRKGRKYILEN
jgi:hypothetical protein